MSLGGREPLHHQPLNNEQRFKLKCDSLSRNDPKITTLDDDDFPIGYGQRLGEALLNNTHVASMRLHNVGKVLGTDVEQAVEKQETENGKVEIIKKYIEPLLEFLQTAPVLRNVVIRYMRNGMDKSMKRMVDLLLAANLSNPNVEKLRFVFNWIPMHFFQTLLPKTMSLKELDFLVIGDHPCTLEKQLLVSEGIKLNSSLTSIEMLCQSELSVAILTGLADKGENHCQLNELIVAQPPRGSTVAFWPALSRYLFAKARGVDFHLKFDFFFTDEDVRELMRCLTSLDAAASGNGGGDDRVIPVGFLPVISKLTLCDCYLGNDDAKDAWRDFFQTRVEKSNVLENESTSSLEPTSFPPIRELHLAGQGENHGSWTAVDLIPLLCTHSPIINDVKPSAKGEQPPGLGLQVATVGSQIQSLSVSLDHSCFDGLFQGLVDKAEQIRIQKLYIPDLGDLALITDMSNLTECIAKVSSLRELDFYDDFTDYPFFHYDIVSCLKENGHIQSVSSNVTSKFVRAYCERNSCLEQLLVESTASDGSEYTSESSFANRQDDTTPAKRTHSEMQGSSSVIDESDGTIRSHKKHKLSKCPTLCMAAMQLPTMRSSLLSRTLLRLPESIGNRETE